MKGNKKEITFCYYYALKNFLMKYLETLYNSVIEKYNMFRILCFV
jgi:hypothetical protein